jgi:hypothetical protein
MDREERIEEYMDDYLSSELAERLVDTEDELEIWKARARRDDRLL